MLSILSNYLNQAVSHANWMFNAMDITQWGLVSVIMVVLGFIAIKVR